MRALGWPRAGRGRPAPPPSREGIHQFPREGLPFLRGAVSRPFSSWAGTLLGPSIQKEGPCVRGVGEDLKTPSRLRHGRAKRNSEILPEMKPVPEQLKIITYGDKLARGGALETYKSDWRCGFNAVAREGRTKAMRRGELPGEAFPNPHSPFPIPPCGGINGRRVCLKVCARRCL